MMYEYNYSFLEQWLKENHGNIQKKEVLLALGVKSNNGLKSWTDGKGPMPVLNILRFCNSFQVPLECFFRDSDTGKVPVVKPERPRHTDMLQPEGGYDNGQRGIGQRQYEDPTHVIPRSSVIPMSARTEGYVAEYSEVEEDYTQTTPNTHQPTPTTHQPTPNTHQPTPTTHRPTPNTHQPTPNTHQPSATTLIELEMKHADQISRLLDIIERQHDEINALQRRLQEEHSPAPQVTKPYQVVAEYDGERMARFACEGEKDGSEDVKDVKDEETAE